MEDTPSSSANHKNNGTAIRIIEPAEGHAFKLNVDLLENLLLNPAIADKKVSVIGVAGAYRKGKSFLLNFFLRYLKASRKNDDEWLTSEHLLEGFSWRGGSERDTSGILVWNEPFIVKDKNGEEIVVLLMDTQGSFDSLSTVKDCATIFALSTMVSSVQIYNVSQNIQEDDLQHLQLFTEYGRLALEDSDNAAKPFQSLVFLIRDWYHPYDAEYGWLGGQRILDKRLETSDSQHEELQQLRRHIRQSFTDINAFLMPHPGLDVATNRDFKGEMNRMTEEFQKGLRTFVPRILDNIEVKRINGQPITCRELVVYVKAYTEVFQGEELPEPKSMLSATAEANNLAAEASAKAAYQREMEKVCGGDAPFMSTAELEQEHSRCRDSAIKLFKGVKKMGGTALSQQFLDKLEDDIAESFDNFVKVNNGKNLFKSMRTPAVLVCALILNYCLQEFFQLLGLEMIASLFTLVIVIAIFALGTWTYSRYSGRFRDAQTIVDASVTWLWESFLGHIFQSSMGPAANYVYNVSTAVASTPSDHQLTMKKTK